jgi:hypothetical protein
MGLLSILELFLHILGYEVYILGRPTLSLFETFISWDISLPYPFNSRYMRINVPHPYMKPPHSRMSRCSICVEPSYPGKNLCKSFLNRYYPCLNLSYLMMNRGQISLKPPYPWINRRPTGIDWGCTWMESIYPSIKVLQLRMAVWLLGQSPLILMKELKRICRKVGQDPKKMDPQKFR